MAIVGSDVWAEELFRAVFWCGQLPYKQLRIFCISENAKDWSIGVETSSPGILKPFNMLQSWIFEPF